MHTPEDQRRWRQKNKEAYNALQRAYRARRKAAGKLPLSTAQTRSWTLRNKYGITLEQFAAMLTSQGNRCAVCRTDDPGNAGGKNGYPLRKTWRVDHCHDSQKVRGILCHRCNVALGLVSDSIETLQSMIKYLTPEDEDERN